MAHTRDEGIAHCEDCGLEAKRIDGILHARWGERWLPVDLDDDVPVPKRETLISAEIDPGGGFMAGSRSEELGKIDDTTLVRISKMDGVETSVGVFEFDAGTEDAEIESFIADVQESEPDAIEVDEDEDDEEDDDGRKRIFFS